MESLCSVWQSAVCTTLSPVRVNCAQESGAGRSSLAVRAVLVSCSLAPRHPNWLGNGSLEVGLHSILAVGTWRKPDKPGPRSWKEQAPSRDINCSTHFGLQACPLGISASTSTAAVAFPQLPVPSVVNATKKNLRSVIPPAPPPFNHLNIFPWVFWSSARRCRISFRKAP